MVVPVMASGVAGTSITVTVHVFVDTDGVVVQVPSLA